MTGEVGVFASLFFITLLWLLTDTVPQNSVAVVTRFGVISGDLMGPGLRLRSLFSTHTHVQTTIQKDKVENIPCGVSGGVLLNFSMIEVINQLPVDGVVDVTRRFGFNYDKFLIYDRIHKEINEWCSNHTLEVNSSPLLCFFGHLLETANLSLSRKSTLHVSLNLGRIYEKNFSDMSKMIATPISRYST